MVRDVFHSKIDSIETMVLQMGEVIHNLLSQLIVVFQQRQMGEEKLAEIIAGDASLDQLEYDIERTAMELLALMQPMAIDLRSILCMIKMSMDLERIGDHIRKISRKIKKQLAYGHYEHYVSLAEMTILLRQMVDQILVAFKEKNLILVKDTLKQDSRINELQRELFKLYIEDMKNNPDEEIISSGVYLLFMTRFLERIGDHVENIGERVSYMITGDISAIRTPDYT